MMSLLLRLASRTASYLGSNKLVIGLVSGKKKQKPWVFHGFSRAYRSITHPFHPVLGVCNGMLRFWPLHRAAQLSLLVPDFLSHQAVLEPAMVHW